MDSKIEHSGNKHSIYVKEECDYKDEITIESTIVQENPAFKGYTYEVIKEEYLEPENDVPSNELSDDEDIYASKATQDVPKNSVLSKQEFKCYLCQEKLSNKTYFQSHMLKHSREKKLSCAECKAIYLQQSQLNNHMLLRHTIEESLYCSICKQKFLKKEILIYHVTMHTCEIFSCDICMKTFVQRAKLTIHLRKHVGGKVYTCKQCKKEFESPNGLKCHKRIHTGDKPFICSTCGVSFARTSKLYRHMRQHSGANPHKCRFCEKTFVRLSDMQRHSKIH